MCRAPIFSFEPDRTLRAAIASPGCSSSRVLPTTPRFPAAHGNHARQDPTSAQGSRTASCSFVGRSHAGRALRFECVGARPHHGLDASDAARANSTVPEGPPPHMRRPRNSTGQGLGPSLWPNIPDKPDPPSCTPSSRIDQFLCRHRQSIGASSGERSETRHINADLQDANR